MSANRKSNASGSGAKKVQSATSAKWLRPKGAEVVTYEGKGSLTIKGLSTKLRRPDKKA